jgi:hypothetical protein
MPRSWNKTRAHPRGGRREQFEARMLALAEIELSASVTSSSYAWPLYVFTLSYDHILQVSKGKMR